MVSKVHREKNCPTEEHLEAIGVAMEDNDIEHGDVPMKLLTMSLDEDPKKWYKVFPDNHLASYEVFAKLFKGRWTTNKDSGMLLMQLNQIKRKEKETMKDFDTIFDNLHSQIPKDLCPLEAVVLLLYLNSFEGKYIFFSKGKDA